MPPEESKMVSQNRPHGVASAAAIVAIVALGLGAWYWYAQNNAVPATHADFYEKLSAQNASFAEAEKLSTQLRFAEALPLYQAALQSATNDDQRLQIKLLIARMMVQTGAYAEAVPLLKEIIAVNDNLRILRTRAVAVEEISSIYARGILEVNSEIFKDEPFKSLLVANRVDMTLRQLHEYAASISPLAIAELWIAQWYAYQLPERNEKSKLSLDTIQDYKAKIVQLFSAADADIAYMQSDGAMGADLRYALVMRAIVTGMLTRKGDTSSGDPHALFVSAIDTYAQTGPGLDCIPRYQYALFMAQTYGPTKKSDIQAVLRPLSEEAYAGSGSCMFLKEARVSAYYRQFPKLLASIDSDFKKFLMTLGWAAADFSP
ncbi:hypothetical protein HY417_04090 [Candidatus Kaiserbacteria bacterium]|nr:hypothetical protein [Candidatus Kaiserbacteria bacterium]